MIRLIFIVCFLTTATASFSQNFELEFKIRPTRTSIYGGAIPERFDAARFCTSSLGVNYVFKSNSLISLGILYDRKGTEDKKTDLADVPDDYWVRDEINFTYLTVPVQFAQRFGKKFQVQVAVGIYGSYLLKAEYVIVDSNGHEREIEDLITVKKSDFGLSGSLAFIIPVRDIWHIKFGIDDYYGLTDVNTQTRDDDRTIKHNSTGISLGFAYRFK